MKAEIIWGSTVIPYRIVRADRTTMEIAVHPDKAVVVKAPRGLSFCHIQERLLRRAAWLKRQFDYFQQFDPRLPPRRYVGGETHLYLGKRYRLKIASGEQDEVKLLRGRLYVTSAATQSPERVRLLLENWYAERAALHFREQFERNWHHFENRQIIKPHLRIRRMRKRWGSLSKTCTLTLNTELIRAPRECVDYVIVHELCHLRFHNHGADFYRLLEKAMPDWRRRKAKLEVSLVQG